MYCLGCYYDLRGLPENRCPECGRIFSPDNPATYSITPKPEKLRKLMKQASAFLADATEATDFGDPNLRAIASLRRQIGRLSAENWELQQTVTALTQVLLDHNLLDSAQLTAAREAITLANSEVVDDTEPTPDPADEAITMDLIELEHAVEVHQKGDSFAAGKVRSIQDAK